MQNLVGSFNINSESWCSTQVLEGAPTKTYLKPRGIAVEEFLQMIRFDQRDKCAEIACVAELPSEL